MNKLVTLEGRKAVVRPEQGITAINLGTLRATLRDVVAQGANEVVMDLSDVTMVDSSGLGLMIAAHNTLKKTGGKIEVIHATKDLLDLFHTMRLHQHFSVTGD